MAVDLKTLSPDTSLPQSGFLFGADSQAVSSPSVFSVPTVKDALNSGVVTLTDAAFISWNVTEAPVARLTLGGNRTLMTPLNIKDGGIYRLYVIQDATGGRTLAYEPTFNWTGNAAPDFSTATAGQIYLLTFWSDGVFLYGSVSSAYTGYTPSLAANFASPAWDVTPPSWLDYSGTTGNRMYFDNTGKLTWAPNNLALYNADFSNGVWSSYYASKVGPYAGTDPAGTNTAYEIGLDGGGGGGSATVVYQTFTAVTGVRYMASFYVRAKTGTTSVRVRFFDGSVNDYSSNITVDSTGWTRVYYAYTSTASSASAFFGINTNSTSNTTNVYVAFAQLEAVTYQTTPSTYVATTSAAYYGPRFDYDPSTVPATPRGLLIEETRTNLLNFSQSFATSGGTQNNWADTNITRNSTNNTSPDGTGNALRVTASAANGTIISSAAIGTSAQRVLSVWLRRVTGTGDIQYTLDNGTNWTTQAITSTWTRYSFAATTANQRVGFRIVTSGDAIEIWGVQLEAAAFSSSYIPTVASTVTRAADVLKASGAAKTVLSATTGTAIMQARVPSIASYVNLLGDASRVLLWADASTTLKSSSTTPSSVALSATIGGAGTWTGGAVRAAVGWSAAGRSIVANNGTVASDSNTFGTATDVPIFLVGNGTIESVAFYATKIPDTTLKIKSTVGVAF